MGKKLILSQEQLDEIVGGMGDYFYSNQEVGNIGNTEVSIAPVDMWNSKDKDGESDVEYTPTDSDDVTRFIAHPDPAAYG